MNIQKIEKLAETFALAAVDPYDSKFRNTVLNAPVMEGAYPFKETAEMVIEQLNKLDPTGADASIKKVVNSLMDILNNHEVPTAQQLMGTSNNAYSLVNSHPNSDSTAKTTAKYLSNLAKMIAYKFYMGNNAQYFRGKGEQQEGETSAPTQQRPTSAEPLWKFVNRTYRALKGGGTLEQADTQRWQSEKGVIGNRLNVLNNTKTRTPQQEQERNALLFLQNRLGR